MVSTAVTVDPTSRPTSAPRAEVAASTVRPRRNGRRPAAVRWIVSPSGMALLVRSGGQWRTTTRTVTVSPRARPSATRTASLTGTT